jgi:hypothetical protein
VYKFYDVLEKAFGPDAVSRYNETKLPEGVSWTFGVPTREKPAWADEADVHQEGVRATAIVVMSNGSRTQFDMSQTDGIWRIDLGQYAVAYEDLVKAYAAMQGPIAAATKAIKEGKVADVTAAMAAVAENYGSTDASHQNP